MADRRLQVFHAVAKHLSFTKAAEALFMTQPAVTFQIRQLEEHFNTRLFDRDRGFIEGDSRLPTLVSDVCCEDEFQIVRIALTPPLIRHLSVVYPKERFHSRLVSGFVRFAKERLAAIQAGDGHAAAA